MMLSRICRFAGLNEQWPHKSYELPKKHVKHQHRQDETSYLSY